MSSKIGASFIIALGDNFYLETGRLNYPNQHDGVTNVTDPQWASVFRNVYTSAGTQIPWYVILGNHDYYAGAVPQAEIQYTQQHIDNRWMMPDHNYTMTWEIPGSGGKHLQIVFIDTPRISPTTSAIVRQTSLVVENALIAEHLAWLDMTLKASTATWLIVAGHYHGKSEYDCVNRVVCG